MSVCVRARMCVREMLSEFVSLPVNWGVFALNKQAVISSLSNSPVDTMAFTHKACALDLLSCPLVLSSEQCIVGYAKLPAQSKS